MEQVSKRDELVESLKIMKDRGLANDNDVAAYLYNFDFMQANIDDFKLSHHGGWVASISGKLYFRETFKELDILIENIPKSNRAYIEEI